MQMFQIKFTHMLDDNIRSFNSQQGFSKSHNDLHGLDNVFQEHQEDLSYGMESNPVFAKNSSNIDFYSYRNMERSDADGWDSPVAWLARYGTLIKI